MLVLMLNRDTGCNNNVKNDGNSNNSGIVSYDNVNNYNLNVNNDFNMNMSNNFNREREQQLQP